MTAFTFLKHHIGFWVENTLFERWQQKFRMGAGAERLVGGFQKF